MEQEPIEGFFAPIRQSGIKPIWIMGVPRRFMIINVVIAAEIVLSLRVWEFSFIPLVIHSLGYYVYNRVDSDFFTVLSRYLSMPDHLEP